MTIPESLAADAEIFQALVRSDMRGITVDYRADRGDWPASWRGLVSGTDVCVYGETPTEAIRAIERAVIHRRRPS